MVARRVNMGKSKELSARARARSKEKGIPFVVALTEISREDPDLIAAAREEVVGDKLEFHTVGDPASTWNITAGELGQRLSELTRRRSKEKSISFREALSEIGRENSDLIRKVREETLGTKL